MAADLPEGYRGPYSAFGKSRGPDIARRLVQTIRGPLATVYACPYCKHHQTMRKGRGMGLLAGVGRGYGLRMGGTLSSQVAAHIRAEHPAEVEAERVKTYAEIRAKAAK